MARKINRKAAELLKRVAKYLVREPEGYSQSDWKQSAANSCGTVCCIAGTVVMLDNPKQYMRLDSFDIQSAALKALGLDEELSINLFSSAMHWPSPFSERYARAKTHAARAKVGAARIHYFLRTGK